MSQKDLKRIAYVYDSGYGPGSDFTLEDWFRARELYHKHKTKCLKAVGL